MTFRVGRSVFMYYFRRRFFLIYLLMSCSLTTNVSAQSHMDDGHFHDPVPNLIYIRVANDGKQAVEYRGAIDVTSDDTCSVSFSFPLYINLTVADFKKVILGDAEDVDTITSRAGGACPSSYSARYSFVGYPDGVSPSLKSASFTIEQTASGTIHYEDCVSVGGNFCSYDFGSATPVLVFNFD